MKGKAVFLIFLMISWFGLKASDKDSLQVETVQEKPFLKKQILPVSLITAGSLMQIGSVKYDIQDFFPATDCSLDDYFRFAPIAQMYVYDLLGFRHANTVFDQSKYLFFSQFVSSVVVYSLKLLTDIPPPEGTGFSFPSGHTAVAFTGATVLFHEFKTTDPILAYSGFVFATATGLLRLTNNNHWVSDVLVGAGIGILSANLVYHFKPLKNWHPFRSNRDITLTPGLSPQVFSLVCRF
jgi:membrane-associated phospholipid phosphatase